MRLRWINLFAAGCSLYAYSLPGRPSFAWLDPMLLVLAGANIVIFVLGLLDKRPPAA